MSAGAQCVLFEGIGPKPVTVQFEEDRISSDGGAILLKAVDKRIQMISSMAVSFTDRRSCDEDGGRARSIRRRSRLPAIELPL